MGIRNSSLTRVKPLFEHIGSDVENLNRFFDLFGKQSLKIDHNSIIEIKYGDDEKKLAPPNSLLIWMLQNLNLLNEVKNYGVSDIESETFKKRKQLFFGDTESINEAINKIQTISVLPKRDWYIFEGYTVPDIYIETTDAIFIGEAKRTEKNITTKTKWLNQRDQLIRHIDSLLDKPKTIYSFYVLEKDEYVNGTYKESMKLYSKIDYFKDSLKHRDDSIVERAMHSFIGYVFWDDIAETFNISFPDTI